MVIRKFSGKVWDDLKGQGKDFISYPVLRVLRDTFDEPFSDFLLRDLDDWLKKLPKRVLDEELIVISKERWDVLMLEFLNSTFKLESKHTPSTLMVNALKKYSHLSVQVVASKLEGIHGGYFGKALAFAVLRFGDVYRSNPEIWEEAKGKPELVKDYILC